MVSAPLRSTASGRFLERRHPKTWRCPKKNCGCENPNGQRFLLRFGPVWGRMVGIRLLSSGVAAKRLAHKHLGPALVGQPKEPKPNLAGNKVDQRIPKHFVEDSQKGWLLLGGHSRKCPAQRTSKIGTPGLLHHRVHLHQTTPIWIVVWTVWTSCNGARDSRRTRRTPGLLGFTRASQRKATILDSPFPAGDMRIDSWVSETTWAPKKPASWEGPRELLSAIRPETGSVK